MTPPQKHKVFLLYGISTVLSLLILFGLIVAHVYIRWAVNQNFSFLPGFALESLMLLVLGELLGLAYLLRAEK